MQQSQLRFPSALRERSLTSGFQNGYPVVGILAPVQESVPPTGYGGTERVIQSLVKGLHGLGVKVHLFASGDSDEMREYSTLHAIVPEALRKVEKFRSDVALRELMTLPVSMRAFKMMAKLPLDIVSNHMGFQAIPASQMSNVPIVTTIHGDIRYQAEYEMYDVAEGHQFISISNSQRKAKRELNYVDTVYNPIDVEIFNPRYGSESGSVWPGHIDMEAGSYVAWIGRFSSVKRPHVAIDAAMRFDVPIVLAGKREPHESDYWDKEIAPRLAKHGNRIVLLGELNDEEKGKLYRGARALLFPINWEEPFGLVGPEAMACGTPVIATSMGAVPEWLLDRKTGYLVEPMEDEEQLARVMAHRILVSDSLSRRACRQHVVEKFSPTAVAKAYLASFCKVIAAQEGNRIARFR